jgi:FkbM family methyltransferase
MVLAVRFMLDNLYNLLYNIRYTKFGAFMGKVYNLLTRERVIVVSRYNVLFELNNRIPAERAILLNIYEPKVTKTLLSLLNEDDVVVDAGAWIGYYTCLAARNALKGRVIAIEPHPENITRLKRNIILNRFENVDIIEAGISDKESYMDLIVSDYSVMHRLNVNSHNNISKNIVNNNTIKVKITTIDNIAKILNIDHIDILIMDIEGYEYSALLGCNQLLSNNQIYKIIMEIHIKYLKEMQLELDDIIKLLKSYNYTIKIIDHINDSINRYHILAIKGDNS